MSRTHVNVRSEQAQSWGSKSLDMMKMVESNIPSFSDFNLCVNVKYWIVRPQVKQSLKGQS